ncbi:MAG: oligopeptidase B, partial [Planctomycetota bacterium]
MSPPIAQARPKTLENHGTQRVDPYYWLRDRDNPEVIDYLNKENAYTDAALEDLKPLEEELFVELKGRIKQDDKSVPYSDRGFVYYTRYEDGKQYPIYCRKAVGEVDAIEEVMLDVNELAEGKTFCSVVGLRVSPNSELLAFGVDFTGRRKYSLKFKDLTTGEMLDDEVDNVTGSCVWANDSKTVFFTRKDPKTLRAYLVVRHKLMTPSDQDVVVFEETDEEFSCGVRKSRSRDYIFIVSNQTLSTEVRYLPADTPEGEFK